MPTATKQSARPLSYEAESALAHRAALDAQIAREVSRFHAQVALDALQTKMRVEVEVAKFRAFEKKYGPTPKPTPKLHRMTDSGGRVWQHRDFSVLKSWMVERNRLLVAQAAAQKTGRGYGEIENKAVYPRY